MTQTTYICLARGNLNRKVYSARVCAQLGNEKLLCIRMSLITKYTKQILKHFSVVDTDAELSSPRRMQRKVTIYF